MFEAPCGLPTAVVLPLLEGHFLPRLPSFSKLRVLRVLALLRGERGGLRQPDRLGPFVNSVCNHVLQEHYRSKKRVEASIDDETEATVAGREPSALSLLEAKDTERVVRQILQALPERDRRLLQSVLLEERDKDEVCQEFGITREYLRVLLHRAKHSFKSFYVDHLGLHQGR